jgi:hypothetical protein
MGDRRLPPAEHNLSRLWSACVVKLTDGGSRREFLVKVFFQLLLKYSAHSNLLSRVAGLVAHLIGGYKRVDCHLQSLRRAISLRFSTSRKRVNRHPVRRSPIRRAAATVPLVSSVAEAHCWFFGRKEFTTLITLGRHHCRMPSRPPWPNPPAPISTRTSLDRRAGLIWRATQLSSSRDCTITYTID